MKQRVKDTLDRPCPFCGRPLYIDRVFTEAGNWAFDDIYCDCFDFRRANRISWKFWREIKRNQKRIDNLAKKMQKLDVKAKGGYELLGKTISLVDADDIKRRCNFLDNYRIPR